MGQLFEMIGYFGNVPFFMPVFESRFPLQRISAPFGTLPYFSPPRATFNKIRQSSPNRPIASQLHETSENSRYRNATHGRLRNAGRCSWAMISFSRLSGATRKKSYFLSPSDDARSRSRSIPE